MANKTKILWVDDEIDLLKAHILFLTQKDFEVATAMNGHDALDIVKDEYFDIIFLDENMPGMTGIETLGEIKKIKPDIPVVMITKSEEETIMEEAIGSKIADYLIKPVNPKQILLTIKKNIDQDKLVTQATTSAYQSEFTKIGMEISDNMSMEDWKNLYRKLVHWEIELSSTQESTMDEVLKMQKESANHAYSRFIRRNYLSWFKDEDSERPLMSHDLLKKKVFPLLDNGDKVFMLVIDNLRYDQYRTISSALSPYYRTIDEGLYTSILPTATMYARNAIFAGLMPSEIERIYPEMWEDDDNDGHKNQHEEALLRKQLERFRRTETLFFDKITNIKAGGRILGNMKSILSNDLSVLVVNFVDIMSHARTEMEMIKELANDEKAYRSLTNSWFRNSTLLDLLKRLAGEKVKVVLTTDHGSIRVDNPIKVVGDRETNTNLRYKLGKNLAYNAKKVFDVHRPKEAFLPARNVSSSYIFAENSDFLAYPNNYNYYANYYKDTFQHGGVSMEEMIIPIITFEPK
ncbi:MAG: response regulator [Bacteroidales bacterium]